MAYPTVFLLSIRITATDAKTARRLAHEMAHAVEAEYELTMRRRARSRAIGTLVYEANLTKWEPIEPPAPVPDSEVM